MAETESVMNLLISVAFLSVIEYMYSSSLTLLSGEKQVGNLTDGQRQKESRVNVKQDIEQVGFV